MKRQILIILLMLIVSIALPIMRQQNDASIWLYNTPTASPQLVISINGNVGIGTANPTEKLDVSGKIALDGVVIAYRPTSMDGTLIIGDGGRNLSHTSGTEGYYNTFVGIGVGSANTTGWRNAAMGGDALRFNTTGIYNTAMGYVALYYNTTGGGNSAMGTHALYSNTTGASNAAMGYQALNSNTVGQGNSAMGRAALYSNTTGQYNAAMGYYSLASNTTGWHNSAIGTEAGHNALGNNNTFIGSYSDIQGGLSLNNATAIGYNAKVATSNALILGGLGADAVRVGIGTATPSYTLEVVGTVNASAFMGDGAAITGTKRYYTLELNQPLAITVTAAITNIFETGNVTMVRVYTKDGSAATLQFNVEKASTILGAYSNVATVTLSSQSNLDTSLSGPVNGNDYLKINMTSVTTTEVDLTIIIEVTKN